MLQIEWPDGWKEWLESLNWDILAWHIDIGGPIIYVIDWVLYWINSIIEALNALSAWAYDFRDEVLDLLAILSPILADPLGWLQAQLDDLLAMAGPILADPLGWLQAQLDNYIIPWVLSKLALLTDWVEGKIYSIIEGLNALSAWAYDFRDEVLDLLEAIGPFINDPTGWLIDKFENEIWLYLTTNVDFFKTLDILVRDFAATLVAFIQDPLDWLWDKFTDWFLGPEEK